jgi:hypothetical protein
MRTRKTNAQIFREEGHLLVPHRINGGVALWRPGRIPYARFLVVEQLEYDATVPL